MKYLLRTVEVRAMEEIQLRAELFPDLSWQFLN